MTQNVTHASLCHMTSVTVGSSGWGRWVGQVGLGTSVGDKQVERGTGGTGWGQVSDKGGETLRMVS